MRCLLEWPDLNVVLNRTEPLPREGRGLSARSKAKNLQTQWGSYANAVGLEIAARMVDPGTRYFVTLHMDTTPCKDTWLQHLMSKMGETVRASGVRMDRARTSEGALHVLGYVFDFQLFRKLGLDFFPDLPGYDVGYKVTTGLRTAGYEVYACANTFTDPALVEKIPRESPFCNLHVDECSDFQSQIRRP